MKNYPVPRTVDDLLKVSKEITRLRNNEDVSDWENLPKRFISGRKVTRIPTSSTNVLPDDREGDLSISVNGNTLYYLVNASGVLAWRSLALATF